MLLKESGFNVIENVPFEIIDDTTDSSIMTFENPYQDNNWSFVER